MGVYDVSKPEALLSGNPYPGRGIITGCSPCGKYAVAAYFIMGRSANSRNRVFKLRNNGDVYTAAFDESKVADPTLIIYNAVRTLDKTLVVTNGDQTDTICDALLRGGDMEEALETREFEPDGPNFTPRISAQLCFGFADGALRYKLSILKSEDAEGSACTRQYFRYRALPGLGHFIHTYVTDGSPIPSFQGEPERVEISGDIDSFTQTLWSALNEDNRISLYVRYTDIESGAYEYRLINKNQ